MATVNDIQRLRTMVTGYRLSKAIYAAVELGIPQLLASGGEKAVRLAARCAAHPEALEQLLRGLVDAGLLVERDGTFALSPLGELLRPEDPAGMSGWIRSTCAEEYRAWDEVLHTVRTGTAGFDEVFGVGFWEYLRDRPDAGARFNGAMSGLARRCGEFVLDNHDLSSATTVVDVGGGDGTVVAMLLGAYPGLTGVVFDLPEVAGEARERLSAGGFADRAGAVGGSFLREVPAGGDVYLLCRVLADWDGPAATRILTSCRRAMLPGATLLVAGALRHDEAEQDGDLHDIHLRVVLGGRQRTVTELRDMLAGTGFRVDRMVHAPDRQVSLAVATAR